MLVGSVDQLPPASSKKSRKKGRDTEEILNLFKISNKHIQKTTPCLLLLLN